MKKAAKPNIGLLPSVEAALGCLPPCRNPEPLELTHRGRSRRLPPPLSRRARTAGNLKKRLERQGAFHLNSARQTLGVPGTFKHRITSANS